MINKEHAKALAKGFYEATKNLPLPAATHENIAKEYAVLAEYIEKTEEPKEEVKN